jgi:membrane-associated phospholipid phosphatase
VSESTSVGLATPSQIPSVLDLRIRLSITEQIVLAFFAYVTFAAVAFHVAARELAIIMTLNFVIFATLMALRRNRERAPWLVAAADLFPALLILVAYRESGLLLTPDPAHHLDNVFILWDRALLQNHFVRAVLQAGAPWLQHYLEFAYLLCYPLVPLGVAAVHFATQRGEAATSHVGASSAGPGPNAVRPYLIRKMLARKTRNYSIAKQGTYDGPAAARGQRGMDEFWAAVLLATLFCYAVYPFFPLTPPRVLFADVPGPHVAPLLRQWNFWLLDHYSVQACLFPSGHVAAVTAVALAVRKHTPRLGAMFLFLAASVALATVYGRYHYAADAVAGALVGVAAYKVARFFKFERLHNS